MHLSIQIQNDHFNLSASGPTCTAPGKAVELQLELTAKTPLQILGLKWKAPDILIPQPASPPFPVGLAQGQHWTRTERFSTSGAAEGFGEIKAVLAYQAAAHSAPSQAAWTHWISVFEPLLENGGLLSDRGRDRLLGVVNANDRNGHIFLADFARFFKEYLNIDIPEHLHLQIAETLAIPQEGLPVDPETFVRIAAGEMTFYGMEKLELLAEEYCVESDDRFDAAASAETAQATETELGA